jgi:hypothetical protein
MEMLRRIAATLGLGEFRPHTNPHHPRHERRLLNISARQQKKAKVLSRREAEAQRAAA